MLAVSREQGEAGDWVSFKVRDFGIGTTPEQLASCSSHSRGLWALFVKRSGGEFA
jgi:hypothetical protein